MKKLLVFILALTYLAEASGISLYKHFCMDRFVSWGLTKGGKNCPTCKMEKSQPGKGFCKGCCKDEQKLIKLTVDHKAEAFTWNASQFGEAVPSFFITDFLTPVSQIHTTWNNIHAPPSKHKVPAFIYNCVFRI
jgi:hypothetical protein